MSIQKLTWLTLSLLIILVLVLGSCGKTTTPTTSPTSSATSTTPSTPTTTTTTSPTTSSAKWWDKWGKPQYGGSITTSIGSPIVNFDVMDYRGDQFDWWFETMWRKDLNVDRKLWNFLGSFVPDQYFTGSLVKSWELPDPLTLIAHLRQGVYWQNKPPVNGREFTSDDVVQHYDRQLGTGSGYTTPSAINAGRLSGLKNVKATDKYTVVFNFKVASAVNFTQIATQSGQNMIEAPECVKLEGGTLTNWKNAVGTGAWILTGYVSDSSYSYIKNTNYWGYDSRYPENRLPYVDKLTLLIIPDPSTRIAALRTGKLDVMDFITLTQSLALTKSNPELITSVQPAMGVCFNMRCDKPPFNDINVRKVLQLAIDRKEIAETFYKGTISGEPVGLVNPSFTGYAFAYADWPQQLKDEYSYNPAKAKQLLSAAGFPTGFKTNVVTNVSGPGFMDPDLMLICKAYFLDIGVDMEIRTLESSARQTFVSSGKHDQMCTDGVAFTFAPNTLIAIRWSGNPASNYTYNNDAGYDELYKKFLANVDPAKIPSILQEADKYSIEKHWSVNLFDTNSYVFWQPYLKGFSGEYLQFVDFEIWAQCWIDQNVKSSIKH